MLAPVNICLSSVACSFSLTSSVFGACVPPRWAPRLVESPQTGSKSLASTELSLIAFVTCFPCSFTRESCSCSLLMPMTWPEFFSANICGAFGEVGREGRIAGHPSCASTPGEGDKDFLKGFSLASIRERRTIGDLGRTVTTGRLGRGLSGELSLRRGQGMVGCDLGVDSQVVCPCCRLNLDSGTRTVLLFTSCSWLATVSCVCPLLLLSL